MRTSSLEKNHKDKKEGVQAFIWNRTKAECHSDSYEYKPPMKELSVHKKKKSIVRYTNRTVEKDG